MNATGLWRNPSVKNTLSIAFFSTAGMLWLWSGVTMRYASASWMRAFQRCTTGSENVGERRSPILATTSWNIGSGHSRRSSTSLANALCASTTGMSHFRTASA